MFALRVSVLLLVVGVAVGAGNPKHPHCHYEGNFIFEGESYISTRSCLQVACVTPETIVETSCGQRYPDKKCADTTDAGNFPDCCKCT